MPRAQGRLLSHWHGVMDVRRDCVRFARVQTVLTVRYK